MNRKAHRYWEKGKKHPDKTKKTLYAFAVNFGIGYPIANKEDQGAYGKKGDHVKIPTKLRIQIFNI